MKRGFTLVELLIVIAVISILSSITIAAYQIQMTNGRDSQRKSMASTISSAAEKFYRNNNEYPSPAQLGGLTTGTVPANYNLASQVLGMPTSAFSSGTYVFVPCPAGANCSDSYLNKNRVYYTAKYNQSDTSIAQTIIPVGTGTAQCMYTMPSGDVGATAYIIVFWSEASSSWQVAKSINGTVSLQRRPSPTGTWAAADTSSSGCPLTAL